jgi:hypothetical protein
LKNAHGLRGTGTPPQAAGVKLVDGRAVNNKFWFFSGALTNVAYTITITDTQTGAVKTSTNPFGSQVSLADTAAF